MSTEGCCMSTHRAVTVVNPYLKKPSQLPPRPSLPLVAAVLEKSTEQSESSSETKVDKIPQKDNGVLFTPVRHTNYGQQVPMEQRLPSRIVSFQAAEHLSVTELREFLTYYTDRSIRTTGVILHRHVIESDASVCLVLSDPLAESVQTLTGRSSVGDATTTPRKDTQPARARTTPSTLTPRSGRSLTSAQTPSDQKTPSSARRTPILGSKRKLVHVPRSGDVSLERTPLIGGSRSKTVYVPKKSTPRNNSLLNSKSSKKARRSIGNKRRLSFSTPTESAINCLVNQQTCVLVIVDPLQQPQISDCGVGDIIMIIGEIVVASHDNATAKAFVSQYRKRLERRDENQVRYIKPRILRNVNGTNVRLQYEALLKRRNHISQLLNDSNQVGRGPPCTKDSPANQAENLQTDPLQSP